LFLSEAQIDLGFLIDGSSTVGLENFRFALDFTKNIFGRFWTPFGSVKIGIVTFGSQATMAFGFDNNYIDRSSVDQAIDGINFPSGQSLLGSALQATKGLTQS